MLEGNDKEREEIDWLPFIRCTLRQDRDRVNEIMCFSAPLRQHVHHDKSEHFSNEKQKRKMAIGEQEREKLFWWLLKWKNNYLMTEIKF